MIVTKEGIYRGAAMKNIELGKSVTLSNQQLSNIIGRINALTPKNSGLDNLHVNLYVMILERIGDEINFVLEELNENRIG